MSIHTSEPWPASDWKWAHYRGIDSFSLWELGPGLVVQFSFELDGAGPRDGKLTLPPYGFTGEELRRLCRILTGFRAGSAVEVQYERKDALAPGGCSRVLALRKVIETLQLNPNKFLVEGGVFF